MHAVLFLIPCLLVILLTPALRQASVKRGILDQPDERKIHEEATPRTGGIAITISVFISMALGYLLMRDQLRGASAHLAGLSIGAAIVAISGIWDDLWGLKAERKMVGQIVAALTLMPFGFAISRLNIPFLGVIDIGWKLGVPLAVFWIAGIVNTINLIDGMDGLAAGVVATISLALFVVSVVTGQVFMAMMCLILAGSAIGFLWYNFHPASIFMGDCGAMFMGFMLAALSIRVLFLNVSVFGSSLVPVLFFGLPIVDTTWAIFRRLRGGRSPFQADRFHIHHRLMNLGLTQRQVVVILYLVSALSVSSGLVIALVGGEMLTVILSVSMLVSVLIGVAALGCISPTSPELPQNDSRLISSPLLRLERCALRLIASTFHIGRDSAKEQVK